MTEPVKRTQDMSPGPGHKLISFICSLNPYYSHSLFQRAANETTYLAIIYALCRNAAERAVLGCGSGQKKVPLVTLLRQAI